MIYYYDDDKYYIKFKIKTIFLHCIFLLYILPFGCVCCLEEGNPNQKLLFHMAIILFSPLIGLKSFSMMSTFLLMTILYVFYFVCIGSTVSKFQRMIQIPTKAFTSNTGLGSREILRN